MLQFRFVFVVFCFTGLSLFTVHLRSAENRAFNRLCVMNSEQSRLKQELWQKQLQLESLISPAAVSQYLEQQKQ